MSKYLKNVLHIHRKRSFHVGRLAAVFQTRQSLVLSTFEAQKLNPPQNLWWKQWQQQLENTIAKTDGTKQSTQSIFWHLTKHRPHVWKVQFNFFQWYFSIQGEGLRFSGGWRWNHSISWWFHARHRTAYGQFTSNAVYSSIVDLLHFMVQLAITLPCLAYVPSTTHITFYILVQDDENSLIEKAVWQNYFPLYPIFNFFWLFNNSKMNYTLNHDTANHIIGLTMANRVK